jgi:hypothetical protein
VIWSAGYNDKESSINMLNSFGLDIDDIPLGPIPEDSTNIKIAFHNAWPIIFHENQQANVICSGWGYPTIISKKFGKGTFVLISDSEFLLGDNIEDNTKYNERNILFLKQLFTLAR